MTNNITFGGGVGPLQGSGPVAGKPVDPATLAEYNKLLKDIEEALKDPQALTRQGDVDILRNRLNRLKELEALGKFDEGMSLRLATLLVFFQRAGYPNNLTPQSLALMKIDGFTVRIGDSTINVFQAFDLALNRKTAETQVLADLILDILNSGYKTYMDVIKSLKVQLDASRQALDGLALLQEIIAKVKARDAGKMVTPVTKWSDLPPKLAEIVEKAMKEAGINPRKSDGTLDDAAVAKFYKESPDAFAKAAKAYFDAPVPFDVFPPLDTNTTLELLKKLLEARDDLEKALKVLKEKGGEATPAAQSLQKVLDSIKGILGPEINSRFPSGTSKDAIEAIFKELSPTDKQKCAKALEDLILGAHDKSKDFGSDIDKAVDANHRLSDTMSDELKTKNQFLNSLFDTLSNVNKTYDKIVTRFAQNVNR